MLNGCSLHPDYELTLKPTSGYMLRAYSMRTMKKRESITREEVTFHTSFPDSSNSGIFVPQQETGTEYNDIPRETTITPAQWKAKVEAGEWFIYAESKVAYNAENGIYELRVKKIHCKPLLRQRNFKRLATPLQPPRTPLHTPYENPPNMGFSKSNFIFPKSNFTIHRTPTGAAERKFIRILTRHFDCAPRMKCVAHLQFPRNSCRRFDSSLTAQGANPGTGDSGGKATGAMPPFRRTDKTGIYAANPAKNPVAGLRRGNAFRPS